MLYRYDPLDFNCEAFVYARKRASRFFRYHKERFCGDRDDLYQEATMAVIQAVEAEPDKSQVPAAVIIDAVEKALVKAIKKFNRQSHLEKLVAARETAEEPLYPENRIEQYDRARRLMPTAERHLDDFKAALQDILTFEQFTVIWEILAGEESVEDKCQALRDACKNKGKGNWRPPTAERYKRVLAESIAIIRLKLPAYHIEQIAKLTADQDLP